MKQLIKKFLSTLVITAMLVTLLPWNSVMAEEAVTVVLKNITETTQAAPILPGEAKILVSLRGIDKSINMAQFTFKPTGNMTYKSIQYLVENVPGIEAESLQAIEKASGEVVTTAVRIGAPLATLKAEEDTPLFVITFAGEPGESMGLSLQTQNSVSYVAENFPEIQQTVPAEPENANGISLNAATQGADPIDIQVSLKMNLVETFPILTGEKSSQSGMSIRISSDSDEYPVNFYVPIKESSGSAVPTMIVETTLIKGQTYTVEIGGPGYTTYHETIVFDELLKDGTAILDLDNTDVVPGELVADGVVDGKDKAEFLRLAAAIEAGEESYTIEADFDRDGKIEAGAYGDDFLVYANIEDEAVAPAKMSKPTVSGGEKSITVKWTKPADDSVTGYVVKYGKSADNLNKSVSIDNASTTETTISSLSDDTTYYAAVAAVNAVGTGAFSNAAHATTDEGEGGGGGGGGTGGNSGGGLGGGSLGGGSLGGSTQTPATPSTGNGIFSDVATDAYYNIPVIWAVNKGITAGTSETTFSPDAGCTRAQVATFLWRLSGSPEPQGSLNPFTDVAEDAYYYNAVLWAVEKGITAGTSETTFSPDAGCTRAQVVTFLQRTAGNTDLSDAVNPFTDVAEDAYYYNAVLWAVEKGITSGTSETAFSPDAGCTRAQVVTFLHRYSGME
ncbi:MAG: hypothetical protein E7418_05655 [Ruminococcaceae bacterium]|nr:hypothetical protein [Oscillospiraceae bacterium]